MPRKNQRQPFWFFMEARQIQERNRNNKHLGFDQLQVICGPEWQKMTPEQKRPYDEKARGHREQRNHHQGVLNSFGRPVQDEIDEIEEMENEEQFNKDVVWEIVNSLPLEELIKKTFAIVSFNVMVRTQEGRYYPLEIGIVKYSIEKGIVSEYHRFIDPGEVPSGYASKAKTHCQDTHKIPYSGFAQAKGNDPLTRASDYSRVFLEIMEMLDDTKTPGIDDSNWVFCYKEQAEQTMESFKAIASETELDDRAMFEYVVENDFRVGDITQLLFCLARKQNKVNPYVLWDDALRVTTYDYSDNTDCPFHYDIENRLCALGLCKRICFMLSDNLLSLYDIKGTSKHLPVQAENTFTTYEVNIEPYQPARGRYFNDRGSTYSSRQGSWANDTRQQSNGHRPRSPNRSTGLSSDPRLNRSSPTRNAISSSSSASSNSSGLISTSSGASSNFSGNPRRTAMGRGQFINRN